MKRSIRVDWALENWDDVRWFHDNLSNTGWRIFHLTNPENKRRCKMVAVVSAALPYITAATAVAGAGISAKNAIDQKKAAKKQRALQVKALQEQQEAQSTQEAAQLRQQNKLNEEEADAQQALVSQRRAIAARRRGRGSLSYTASSGLKTKLGE